MAWESEPFGDTSADQDPDGDGSSLAYGLRFPGQYADAETGLNYNNYRDYDPVTGRYTQSDPIGLAAGVNTYSYTDSSPISRADPLGLWAIKFSAYRGYGFSITVGSDGGRPFARVGVGVGLGGGVKLYPDATFPSSPKNDCACGSRVFVGSSASVGFSFGPLSYENKAQAGGVASFDCDGKLRLDYIEESKFDKSLKGKADIGLSLGGGINIFDLGVAR